MAGRLTERPRLTLVEFGSPVLVPQEVASLERIEAASRAWQSRLGLPGAPFALEYSNGAVAMRARYVTGVARLGDLDVEVVPKFLSSGDYAGTHWRAALWRILTAVDGSPAPDDPLRAAETETLSFADLMADAFIWSYRKGASRGLPRRYKETFGTGALVRGSLDATRTTHWVASPWDVPYRSDELSEDTDAGQLIKWASKQLARSVTSPRRARMLVDLALSMGHVSDGRPDGARTRAIRLGPQHQGLQGAIGIAKLLIQGHGLDYDAGLAELGGFLWDSDDVYERFVFVLCSKAARGLNLRAEKRQFEFAKPQTPNTPTLSTTPDVIFRLPDNSVRAVLDAKYKRLGSRPRSTDSYQVLTAAHAVGSRRVGLVYPVDSSPSLARTWSIASMLGGVAVELTAIPLDVLRASSEFGIRELVGEIEKWLFGFYPTAASA